MHEKAKACSGDCVSSRTSDQFGYAIEFFLHIVEMYGQPDPGIEAKADEVVAAFDTAVAKGKEALDKAGLAGSRVAFADGWVADGKVSVRPFTKGSLLTDINTELGLVTPGLRLRTLSFMASRISELVLKCVDPELLARFWGEVLGYVELDREDVAIEIGPAHAGFGGLQPTIILSPSSEPRTGQFRLHIDINPVDRDQEAELERLLALGARPADVGQTGDEQWHVLADPEGNEFCLLRKRLEP